MDQAKMIYLDNGATTPLDPAVLDEMLPYLRERFGNPSSLHRVGAAANAALRSAREAFAQCIDVAPEEVIFTGGGTEADNLAVRGVAMCAPPRRRHALLFALEHPAVSGQRELLESRGFTVEEIPCSSEGLCDVGELERLLRPDETALVAVMHANNEIGTIQPVEEIGELLEDICPEAAFHVDAVQSFTKIPVRPRAMGASTVAFAAHKVHGPKGVGALYVRPGTRLRPLLAGGGQERAIRPGTENIAGIVGLAAAARIGVGGLREDAARMRALRDRLIDSVLSGMDGTWLNGHREMRLCNNVNVSFRGARAEVLLHALEELGIMVSSGSACHAGQTGPSKVLRAIGRTEEDAGSLRLTLSRMTTAEEVDTCAAALREAVTLARA